MKVVEGDPHVIECPVCKRPVQIVWGYRAGSVPPQPQAQVEPHCWPRYGPVGDWIFVSTSMKTQPRQWSIECPMSGAFATEQGVTT